MNNETKNWAAFGGEYLKAIEVLSNTDEYAIIDVDSRNENGKTTLILEVQHGEVTKLFGCNATNLQAVQAICPNNAEEAIGRIITFNKVQVTNPQTKLMVDGLRLQFKPKAINEVPVTVDSGVQADGSM